MKEKQRLAGPSPKNAWTRAEDYIGAMARTRSFRRAHREKVRTQPERPRLLLSTVPFLTLIAFLAVLAIAIMIIAFPGAQPQQRTSKPDAKEKGVAERGWFQEAQKQFH